MIRIRPSRGADDTVTVTFAVQDGHGPVSVVGDFNGWDPLRSPMRRRSNGTRSVAVDVPRGHEHEFRYLADGGRWLHDADLPVRGDNNVLLAS